MIESRASAGGRPLHGVNGGKSKCDGAAKGREGDRLGRREAERVAEREAEREAEHAMMI